MQNMQIIFNEKEYKMKKFEILQVIFTNRL